MSISAFLGTHYFGELAKLMDTVDSMEVREARKDEQIKQLQKRVENISIYVSDARKLHSKLSKDIEILPYKIKCP